MNKRMQLLWGVGDGPKGEQCQETIDGEALGTKLSAGGNKTGELCEDPERKEVLVCVM